MPIGHHPGHARRRRARPGAARRLGGVAAAALTLSVAAGASAQAQSPVPDLPRSFLLAFNDQLGVPGSPAGIAVTPGGNVYAGWGELDLEVGDGEPFHARSHTLEDGRYPIVRMFRRDRGTLYTLTLLSAGVRGDPAVLARVDVRNLLSRSNRARVTAAFVHDDSELTPRVRTCCIQVFRFPRAREPTPRDGLFFQPGVRFSSSFRYRLAGRGALVRDGRTVLFYPPAGSAQLTQTLSVPAGTREPETKWGRSAYDMRLAPRARRSLLFRMPVEPVAPGTAAHRGVSRLSFAAARAQVRAYYGRLLRAGMAIELPERKVTDTFHASLVNMALPRYRLPNGQWVQTVNNLRYHSFYLRDAAVMTRAFDLAGLRAIARQNLEYFFTWQQADGLFVSRPQELDGFGQALWAFAEHYRLTRDAGFARRALPAVRRAMGWFTAARAADPRGLMPAVSSSVDNDLVTGHLVGDNFWAAAGVRGAAELARAAGDPGTAARWSAIDEDHRARLRRHITAQTPRGPIRSSLDRAGGQSWGPLWASYISEVFPAGSPVVQNTMRRARRLFREGIMTYLDRRLLHHYSGFRVFQTDLAAGHQRAAVRGLYSALAHTTSTNAGWEAATAPFGDRVVDDATTPHGWWAAEYVTFLRNMLVREQGDDVWLMSALSPSWLGAGRTVAVRRAPTAHGVVSFRLRSTADGAVLTWSSSRLRPGTQLRWPVPAAARGVSAPGLRGGVITLPGRRGRISVRWRLAGPRPSYEGAFAALERAYARSPNGATARGSGADRGRGRFIDPGDLDRYRPLWLAGGGR